MYSAGQVSDGLNASLIVMHLCTIFCTHNICNVLDITDKSNCFYGRLLLLEIVGLSIRCQRRELWILQD